ncbi:PAS domain-containing protein [Romboutsia weinsteinii]|uniref:histidine kinase n=2 Tax=Romboutsia weinsteinii TaxID=2020949 RepID=A0A371JAK9_9FIRM|nr:PAS domain-containing protein [Romboutsia weinsteinii]
MFFILMIVMFISEDILRYGVHIHILYAVFLISMGVIAINTIRFNKNSVSIFLGMIFAVTGVFDIIYLFIIINSINSINTIKWMSIISTNIISILPAIGIFFSFNYIERNRVSYVTTVLVTITSIGILLLEFVTGYDISKVEVKWVEVIASLSVVILTYLSLKKSKAIENEEQKYLNRILIILVLSRIPIVLGFMFADSNAKFVVARIIVSLSIIYIYKYMVYTNIRKPYEELNIINEELVYKSKVLKENNEKLIENSKKMRALKALIFEKESKLRARLDASSNSVIVFSEEKEIIYTNKTFNLVFQGGCKENTPEYYLKTNIYDYDNLINNIENVLSTEENMKSFIYSTNDKVYQATFAPLLIKDEIKGALCILIDKTTEKAFEKEITETNLRYESFLESIGDGIIVLQDNKKIYINKACKKIFKDRVEEIEFYLNRKKDNKEELYVIDGEAIYVEMSYSEYSKYGKHKTIIVVRDITRRKIAQMKLRESQNSYSRLIDILPDGICLLNRNLEIEYANQSLLKIIGISDINEILNTNIKKILDINIREEYDFDKKMRKILDKSKHLLLLENEIINKDKKSIQVEINALPFEYSESKNIMLIIKDITHKKDSEKVERELLDRLNTDKVKTEFFANMSHELKTPLNVISSANQLIDSFYQNGKVKDYNDNIKSHIDLVRQNSYRLQRLINNIIDLTKMESGYYKLMPGKYNIVSIIEDLFMKVENYASKKDISIIFDTELEEIYLQVDKYQIERAMLNLLSNCIKFTPNGGKIYLNIYDRKENIVVSVKDTGVGIPRGKLDIIFEEFTQVDTTLSRNTEGSGIGLAIVKNLVKLHGGKIKVISEENRGTEFLISLPVESINGGHSQEDRSIYNIDEEIKVEFSDIYY